jgi:hypothetical protein
MAGFCQWSVYSTRENSGIQGRKNESKSIKEKDEKLCRGVGKIEAGAMPSCAGVRKELRSPRTFLLSDRLN